MPIDYNEPLIIESKAKKRNKNPTAKDLEKALATLKALGFSINIPTSEEDINRQQASLDKLGFSSTGPLSSSKQEKHPTTLVARLCSSHCIAGTIYGPGDITLPYEEATLFQSLLQADQAAIRATRDTVDYNPVARCFLIKPGNGKDTHNKYTKRAVSEAEFSAGLDVNGNSEATITAGAYDIAGYARTQQSQQF